MTTFAKKPPNPEEQPGTADKAGVPGGRVEGQALNTIVWDGPRDPLVWGEIPDELGPGTQDVAANEESPAVIERAQDSYASIINRIFELVELDALSPLYSELVVRDAEESTEDLTGDARKLISSIRNLRRQLLAIGCHFDPEKINEAFQALQSEGSIPEGLFSSDSHYMGDLGKYVYRLLERIDTTGDFAPLFAKAFSEAFNYPMAQLVKERTAEPPPSRPPKDSFLSMASLMTRRDFMGWMNENREACLRAERHPFKVMPQVVYDRRLAETLSALTAQNRRDPLNPEYRYQGGIILPYSPEDFERMFREGAKVISVYDRQYNLAGFSIFFPPKDEFQKKYPGLGNVALIELMVIDEKHKGSEAHQKLISSVLLDLQRSDTSVAVLQVAKVNFRVLQSVLKHLRATLYPADRTVIDKENETTEDCGSLTISPDSLSSQMAFIGLLVPVSPEQRGAERIFPTSPELIVDGFERQALQGLFEQGENNRHELRIRFEELVKYQQNQIRDLESQLATVGGSEQEKLSVRLSQYREDLAVAEQFLDTLNVLPTTDS